MISRCGRCRAGPSGVAGIGVLITGRHRCDKAIAMPGYRLDAAAVLSVLIENVTQLCNLDIEVGLFDDPSPPHHPHDLVFRHQFSMPLEQQTEQGEPAPAEWNWFGHTSLVESVQTATAAAIEAESVEQQNVSGTALIHDPSSQRSCKHLAQRSAERRPLGAIDIAVPGRRVLWSGPHKSKKILPGCAATASRIRRAPRGRCASRAFGIVWEQFGRI